MQTIEPDLTARLEAAQTVYLDRVAPGYRTWRARWSGGTTQVIEIGAGPSLLLVHGGMGDAFQWGPLLAPLARQHRVIAVDRPGHGLADPVDYRGVDLLAHARQFLGEMLDAAQVEAAPVIANSMGGLWAVALALAAPERVPRLVLVGSPAGVKRQLPLMLRLGTFPVLKLVAHRLMLRPTRKSVHDFWRQLLVAHAERLDDDLLDLAVASQARNAPSWFRLIDSTVEPGGFKRELLLHDAWRKLAMPTTLIWGEEDAFARPEEGAALVASHPRLRLVRIADAGHAPWFDQPEQVAQAIETALA